MKKYNLLISLIIVVIVLVVIFTGQNKNNNDIKDLPYLSIIEDSQTSNYQGVPYYNKIRNMVAFDLNLIPDFTPLFPSKLYDSRPSDNKYGLIDFNSNKDLRLINIKDGIVESFAFPEVPAFTIDYTWIGNQMLIHYFSANGLTAGRGVNRDTPRQDHFYFFDPDIKKYIPIEVDQDTSKYTAHDYNVYFVKKDDKSKYFAVSVCSKRDSLGECRGYGFSVSNGKSIRKLFDLEGSFTWGWKNDNFFVRNDGKVYVVDLTKIPW